MITRIDAEGLMNQLGDEIVPSYESTGKDLDTVVGDLLGYQRKEPAITKGTIEPTWEDLSGWITPTNHQDPDNKWTYETLAYDDETGSYAYSDLVAQGAWSSFLELHHAGIVCNKIRVMAFIYGLSDPWDIDLDAYYDGAWRYVYQGSGSNNSWMEKDIGYTTTVTALRARFKNNSLYVDHNFGFREADFWGVEGGKLEVDNQSILRAFLQLYDIVNEGFIEVDNDRKLNWWNDIGEDKGQQLRYRKNISGMTREVDWGELCTRLLPVGNGVMLSDVSVSSEVADKDSDASYGYLTLSSLYSCYNDWTGEGDALPSHITIYEDGVDVTTDWEQGEDEHTFRCDIGDYDAGAVYTVDYERADYLIAWDTVAAYGVITKVWRASTVGTVGTLLELARARLTDAKTPPVTYAIDAVDLAEFDGFEFDELQLGSILTVIDEDMDINVSVRVTKITKPDLMHPAKMQLELSNKTKNLADIISDIRINA